MSLKALMSNDLSDLYKTLSDAQAAYNGSDIDVIIDDSYEIESIADKIIRVQTSDVPTISTGEIFTIDSKSYKVMNFSRTTDGLEIIIALGEL